MYEFSGRGLVRQESHYDTAMVCENGHLITDRLELMPEVASQFCSRCSARTISECPMCSAAIRGEYVAPGVVVASSNWRRPTYCYSCASPMPWTTRAATAAHEMAAKHRWPGPGGPRDPR